MSDILQANREKKAKRRLRNVYQNLERQVFSLFKREEVEELARECGFYLREPREIRAFEFVVSCALASVVEGKRGFATVWRVLAAAAGVEVARSAVIQRFGRGSAALLETIATRAMARLQRPDHPELLAKLEMFKQVIAEDATVLKLSPLLKKLFPATRINTVAAAAKLHATADVAHRQILKVEVMGERDSELAVTRSSPVVRGTLYLRDLAFTDYEHFADVKNGGAHLLYRMKVNANPTIVHVRHGVRCPGVSVGKKFNEIEFTKTGRTFDLDARFEGKNGSSVTLRVVGVWNPETGMYHCYITTLAPEEFTTEEIRDLYSLRWVIELLFKLLKSSCHLDHLDTGDKHALRTQIYASVLAATVLSSLCIAAATSAGIPPSMISALMAGIAAPLIAVPLMLLWLGRPITREELATMIVRTLVVGCCDQNPSRTAAKWGTQ